MFETALCEQMNAATPCRAVSPIAQNLLLICCDHRETRALTGSLNGAYNLIRAAGKPDVFSALEKHPVDLFVINMDPRDPQEGMQTCSLLKSMPLFAHLPVVLLIPANDDGIRIRCLQSGADACVEKPLSSEHLRVQIRNLLANRQLVYHHLSRSLTFSPSPVSRKREDSAFLRRLNGYMIEHLSNPGLNVDDLARLMNMSVPTLYRRIKSVSDSTPIELMTIMRLDKAAALLAFGGYKVLEIVKMVGFHSRSNFGKAFIKRFGVTPKEYQQRMECQPS